MDPLAAIEQALRLPNGAPPPRPVIEALAARMPRVELPAGAVVFAIEDTSQCAYFVLDGVAEVRIPGPHGRSVERGAGEIVGEMALLTTAPRTAAVVAATDMVLLRLDPETYEAVVSQEPTVLGALRAVVMGKMLGERLDRGLRRCLGSVPSGELDRFAAGATRRYLERGEPLAAPGGALHLCLGGELFALAPDERGVVAPVARLEPGDLVGAAQALAGGPSSAVLAGSSAWVAEWDPPAVADLLARAPLAAADLARVALSQLRPEVRAVPPSAHTVLLVPVGEPDGLDAFAAAAAAALGPDVRVLDHAALVAAGVLRPHDPLTPSSLGTLRLRLWLDAQRGATSHVVLLGDPEPSPWTRRLLGEADHVLFVGSGPAPPALSAAEACWSAIAPDPSGRRRASLVLLHPPDAALPTGTAAWLDPRAVGAWYHVRRGHPGDHGRLARWLRGEAVGLALSGGGARSLAHLGVARALREADVPVDLLAGTSGGAILAAVLAEDGALDGLGPRLAAAAAEFGHPWRSLDLPVLGLLHHRRARAALHALVGGRHLEDLWIPTAVVTTDLSACTRAVHRRGALVERLLASSAPPGVAAPVVLDGHLHCDGGVVENLPVRVLLEAGCRRTLACSVGLGLGGDEHVVALRSPWSLLWEQLTGRRSGPALPTLPEVVIRAMGMASDVARYQSEGRMDLLIRPPVGAFPTTDFTAVDTLADHARRHTREVLAARPDLVRALAAGRASQ